MVRQTHSVVFTGGPRAAVFVCRRKCVAGKLPCNALAIVWALAQADCEALGLLTLFTFSSVPFDDDERDHDLSSKLCHRGSTRDCAETVTYQTSRNVLWKVRKDLLGRGKP